MLFSVIIPSYNQHDYIRETLLNVTRLKELATPKGIGIQIILVDNNSSGPASDIIKEYVALLDKVIIEADKGQYDAINKGLGFVKGEYWTWLNTDDLLDEEGFFKMVEVLKEKSGIDFIYGGIDHIDSRGEIIRSYKAHPLSFERLVTHTPGIFQQGSFFRKSFTDKIGLLKAFNCSFDYEYVLRCLAGGANICVCDFKVANFRHYTVSKTGSLTPVFIREQLVISKMYGRKWYHFLSWFSALRLIKHKLFPRS